MSGARDAILGRIRRNLGADGRAASEQTAAERLDTPRPREGENIIPARGQKTGAELLQVFRAMAEQVDTTVVEVAGPAAVPAAVTDYLAERNLPAEAVMAPDPGLDDIPWADNPLLTLRRGRAQDADTVGITPVVAGIAETGTLLMLSGEETPTTLNFMPDIHIAIVRASQVVGTYEETWEALRGRTPRDGDGNFMPRTVNWVTGPSRTGDIDKTIFLGAHGPRKLHIVLVRDDEETAAG